MTHLICLAVFLLQSAPGSLQDLAAAEKLWLKMGMSALSKNSLPILIPLGWASGSGGPEQLGIGFTNPADASEGCILLGSRVYTEQEQASLAFQATLAAKTTADWSITTADRVGNGWFSHNTFASNTTLCAAILSDLGGHHDFALRLLSEYAPKPPTPFIEGGFYLGDPIDRSIACNAALEIATHLANELMQPDSDRTTVLTAIRKLNGMHLLTPGRFWGLDELIQSLQATVEMQPEKAGTPEAAVADLINATGIVRWSASPDPRYKKVRDLGLRAVPALIGHLGDHRLTRSFFGGLDMAGPAIIPIGWAAEQLLNEISGGKIGDGGEPITTEQALKWYQAQIGK